MIANSPLQETIQADGLANSETPHSTDERLNPTFALIQYSKIVHSFSCGNEGVSGLAKTHWP